MEKQNLPVADGRRLGRSLATPVGGRMVISDSNTAGQGRGSNIAQDRVRNAVLREAYAAWRGARGTRVFPRPQDFDLSGIASPDDMFAASIDTTRDPIGFHSQRVGAALAKRFGDALSGAAPPPFARLDAAESLGSLLGAYRSCVRTGAPSYDYARYDFGDGSPLEFERLILPMSSGGAELTTLTGIVLFTEPATQGALQ